MSDRSSICAVACAIALMAMPAAAQVVDFAKYPDFKGQWVRAGGTPNNWIALAGQPPLTPEYQKIWADIKADLDAGGPGNWPSTFCIPAGMPAMMSFYDPMEMVVMPDVTYILISHNDDSIRRIYTDGRPWPATAELTYAGYSIGKWLDEDGDGKYDVLEIETRFLKNPRGYDTSGIPFHSDNQTVIKERIVSRQGRPQYAVRPDHGHRQCIDAALHQDPAGDPQSKSASGLVHGRLLGKQHPCANREPKLFSQCGRQADAIPEGPDAAGFELFQP